MLQKLSILNAALIESADIEFSNGLNVLSGETGAGKSVILDCIDFVLGAKADKGMIRTGAEECSVRAEFSDYDPHINEILADLDIESDETLIVSRKINREGRGSLKLNGYGVTASMLRRVTSLLVDIHGQSEHFFLLKESNQLRLLDSIGGEAVAEKKSAMRDALAERKRILADLALIGGDEGERDRRADILRYQIDEIERTDIKEGEEEKLIAFRERHANAEKILGGLSAAREYLQADGGGLDALNGARRALSALAKFDAAYGALAERLENVAAEAEDIAGVAESFSDELDVDEAEAERVENRLDEIKTVKKKYGSSVGEVIAFAERAKKELALLTDSGERFQRLSAELETADKKLYAACIALTEERKAAAKGFTRRVTEELKTLNISSARFEIEFEEYDHDLTKVTNEGLGGVRFLFSANAGEPLKELGKIISGGEMSRFMLAVKAQLSSTDSIGTYIFDEIDAGIGGNTARVVAEKFCKISRNAQIVAVSHLAQIASFADREFLIVKQEEGGRTLTRIRELSGEQRVAEIARLIGGNQESEYALKHAEELLNGAQTYKNSLS